jgi:hypothetical protein
MKYLEKYKEWVSSSTRPISKDLEGDIDFNYTSSDKIFYGVHNISLSRNGKNIEVKAKFDTGARSSSIDFSVGRKLGISEELIRKCKELDNIEVPKSITKSSQIELERKYSNDLKKQFPDITRVQMSKSSSGFSIRAYIEISIHYNGNNVKTEANLRDRSGLSCEMLVGLKDMIYLCKFY